MAVSSVCVQGATAAGIPSLSRDSPRKLRRPLAQVPVQGLRLPVERFALKSAFYNAGARIPMPEADGVAPPRITMRVATKGAYICRDCGYIYNERKPFEKLPDDYFCPVCSAPKRRFKPYDVPVEKNANQTDVRKARKEQLKRDASIGNALPIAIVIGLAGLVGTFLYLNSQL